MARSAAERSSCRRSGKANCFGFCVTRQRKNEAKGVGCSRTHRGSEAQRAAKIGRGAAPGTRDHLGISWVGLGHACRASCLNHCQVQARPQRAEAAPRVHTPDGGGAGGTSALPFCTLPMSERRGPGGRPSGEGHAELQVGRADDHHLRVASWQGGRATAEGRARPNRPPLAPKLHGEAGSNWSGSSDTPCPKSPQ